MEINKKKALAWGLFGLYFFIVTQIILVKEPRFFIWRMKETFRRHHFGGLLGIQPNFKPFRTIWHMLYVEFDLYTAVLNIGGNILLFIPMGIFLPMYFNAPLKGLKTIVTCFLLSTSFELFQLITSCGLFDVDDIFLNTLGGFIGLWMYSLFINHSAFSLKKWVVTYAPKQRKTIKLNT